MMIEYNCNNFRAVGNDFAEFERYVLKAEKLIEAVKRLNNN